MAWSARGDGADGTPAGTCGTTSWAVMCVRNWQILGRMATGGGGRSGRRCVSTADT